MKDFFQITKFAKPFKGLIAQIAIAIVVVALYKQVAPLVTKHVIDTLQLYLDGEIVQSEVWDAVLLAFGLFLIFTILNWIAGRVSWRQAMILQEKLKGHMRVHMLDHLLRQDIGYFDKQTSGNIMSKVDRGISRITNQIGESTSFFLPNILAAILAIIVISQVKYEFVLLMLVAFVPFVLVNLWAINKHEPYQKRFNKIYDIEYGHFWEVLSSVRLVKSFNKREFEKKKMRRFNRKIYRLNSKIEKVWDVASIKDLFLDLWVFGLNIYLVSQVITSGMTIGTYVLLTQYTITLREPLWNMTWMYFEYKKAMIAAGDLIRILNRKPLIEDAQKAVELEQVDGRIMFNNVTFGYKPSATVFENLSFIIEDGQTVALVGRSGSGKTTVANLLNRFYEVDSGKITIDNHDIRAISQESLRESIGVVLQESYLFDDTIEANLKYGKGDATIEEMIRACKMANAWEFIKDLDKGLKTRIGERGVKLSGGQKQRLSIARTILKDPPILVFDEATSSLDSESEAKVQQAVFRLIENRSTIIIAHRLSTVRRADKIIVLGNKSIKELGTHEELMKLDGIYAKLYKMQSHREQSELLEEYEMV
ncbi:ATP-binding cassette domain-containing protein [Candidatus Dojkabacteria bacterium]|nr:ATP-binding cassette domain-containing protein [Candidatus Dojkabacteria bacterium]